MTANKSVALLGAAVIAAGAMTGCAGGGQGKPAAGSNGASQDSAPFPITMAVTQVGDIPAKGSEIEQAIEKYTNTKLDIQWIPSAAYDEKINVMIASSELPKLLKVKYVPTIISSIESGLFWEIGPYLKDYKNLSAQDPQYYDNIKVGGKLYGIPTYRDIGRGAIVYRQDWLDNLGLKPPTTLDEWYNVLKAMTLNDPDRNGKNDTYGMVLSKKYNDGVASLTTRIAVSQGAPNKWAVENGKFIPEFVTKEYTDVLKLFKRLYDEKLINQDFAVFDDSEVEKVYDAGRAGVRVAVAQNAKSMQDRLVKNVPSGVFDVMSPTGPKGVRVSGESGNNGFFVIPKSTVKTEAELKKVLAFLDKMMDEPMSTLQMRGVEGKHYVKADGNKTEYKDFSAFQREVKPYRDNLLNIEGYNVAPLKDTPLGDKGNLLAKEGTKHAVPNPALTLPSGTYSERGKELEQMINDAQTKYIMGKIDDAGWQAEIEKWRKAGGDKVIKEYEEAYAKVNKK
ncbi:extracellular solute-binding protein [Paenibacillus allorhizosphaerae]|uniref:Lipoprotein LipO n=1 Tax=Paenibacillus allorhizosphaerae TaxID=2849866 RepID=A0ABN7TP98_9BACL|nr:extracellular solute-binding protein [Paenibacillus allorhizosphaerae]CAG7649482.1 Lipoprotein LipO [Paenibacillus allorhizosphaerae]